PACKERDLSAVAGTDPAYVLFVEDPRCCCPDLVWMSCHPTRDGDDGTDGHGEEQQDDGRLSSDVLKVLPCATGREPEQGDRCGPQGAAQRVVRGEGPVRHPRYTGEPWHECSQRSSEPAEEHGWTAALRKISFRSLPASAADNATDAAGEQWPTPATADEVPDSIAGNGAADCCREHGRQAYSMLDGQHPAE